MEIDNKAMCSRVNVSAYTRYTALALEPFSYDVFRSCLGRASRAREELENSCDKCLRLDVQSSWRTLNQRFGIECFVEKINCKQYSFPHKADPIRVSSLLSAS